MTDSIITVEHISKRYQLGEIGAKTIRDGVHRWWDRLRGMKRDMAPHAGGEELWALRDVSFEVKRGEVLGIIGRNGAGKSTLLKILTRITEPTSGRAIMRGRVASLLEVGTGFHSELSGRENIFLNGTILGMKRREISTKFDEIVAFSEVERFIDTPVKRYSSGMYVRLAFAVAAYLDPDILIVDEVLAVGDARFQKKCLGKMQGVATSGRTVLFVSHNMPTIQNLCQRVAMLESGILTGIDGADVMTGRYLAQSRENASRSLRERCDRDGSGVVRFVNTWVEGEEGVPGSNGMSGRDLTLVAVFECHAGQSVRNAKFAMALYDDQERQLTDLTNEAVGQVFLDVLPRVGRVRCKLSRLPLHCGQYFFNLMARSAASQEVWDFVQHAGSFTVEPGDYFGTGRAMQDRQGILLIDQSWELATFAPKDERHS